MRQITKIIILAQVSPTCGETVRASILTEPISASSLVYQNQSSVGDVNFKHSASGAIQQNVTCMKSSSYSFSIVFFQPLYVHSTCRAQPTFQFPCNFFDTVYTINLCRWKMRESIAMWQTIVSPHNLIALDTLLHLYAIFTKPHALLRKLHFSHNPFQKTALNLI